MTNPASEISVFNITPGSGVLTHGSPPALQYRFRLPFASSRIRRTNTSIRRMQVRSTVTGLAFDPNTGILRTFRKGSTFATVVGTPDMVPLQFQL